MKTITTADEIREIVTIVMKNIVTSEFQVGFVGYVGSKREKHH